VVAALALAPALLAGARRPALALAAAVLGSLLVAPYLNAEDLAALVVVGWLVLREERTPHLRAAALVSYPAVVLAQLTGPAPQLAVEAAWLVGLAWLAARGGGVHAAQAHGLNVVSPPENQPPAHGSPRKCPDEGVPAP
jgi:hypothetical protein